MLEIKFLVVLSLIICALVVGFLCYEIWQDKKESDFLTEYYRGRNGTNT